VCFELWFYMGHCSPERWVVVVGVAAAVYVTAVPSIVGRRSQTLFGLLFLVMHSPTLFFLTDSVAFGHPEVRASVKLSTLGSCCGIVGVVFYAGFVSRRSVCCYRSYATCFVWLLQADP
jgi:hypothetical protein